MKRVIFTMYIILISGSLIAQKANVNRALSYKESGELGKALESIQSAINPENEKSEKSINWPKTWEVRGEIYQAIYHSNDIDLKRSINEPLTEALNSYKKALEFDTNNKYSKSIKIKLMLLINDLQNNAQEAFNDMTYQAALKSLEQILEINSLPVITENAENSIDTVLIYNCGLAALNANQYDKAIDYFKETARYNYNGSKPYIWIARVYEQKKDSVSALESLEDGFNKNSNDIDLINEIIRIYMNLNLNDEAMKYLDTAIKMNPYVTGYYVAKGNVYENINDEENAIESYEKAISIDPQSFEALFNLGVIYYNKGVIQVEIANKVDLNDNATYQAELNKSEIWWKKSIPFMEKCMEIEPENTAVLESLKTLYFRLKMMDKYNEVLQKL